MANLSTYGAAQAAAAFPNGVYLALGTGQSAAGLLGEPSGGGYARQAVTLSTVTNAKKNAAGASTFGPASLNHGTLTHGALYDAASGGNCLAVGALTAAVSLNSGDSVSIAQNDFTLTFATAA